MTSAIPQPVIELQPLQPLQQGVATICNHQAPTSIPIDAANEEIWTPRDRALAMLEIKMSPLALPAVRTADPGRAVHYPGIQISIYTGLSTSDRLAFHIAFLICMALIFLLHGLQASTGATDPSVGLPLSPATLACGFLAAYALLLFHLARRIASTSIHYVPLAHPLPTVVEADAGTPRSWIQAYLSVFLGRRPQREFDSHLAVRLTEPNASDRLNRYMRRTERIDFDALDRGQDTLSEIASPTRSQLRRFATRQSGQADQKRDVWPIVRLALARVLYRQAKAATHHRIRGEEQIRPDVKGAHLYLAFKLNILPFCYWLLLLVICLALPSIALEAYGKQAAKDVSAALSFAVLVWALCTVIYNKNLVTRWRRWLAQSGNRPLGYLPLFLYIYNNEPHSKWEELDEFDFRVPLDDYVLDINTAFQLTVGFFASTAFAFSRLAA